MKASGIAKARLRSQKIAGSELKDAKAVVSWMGAMQAQDFEMAKWAIGLRLPGAVRGAVEDAIDRGDILRTHLLRPTWHLVAAEDIRWILELTGPRIKAAVASRERQLGIGPAAVSKSIRIMERALGGGAQLARSELVSAMQKGGVSTGDSRASHLFLRAELEGVLCSGAVRGRDTRYALLDDRAPKAAKLDREEALARLARRYFASRGPATTEDFAWWSGLAAGEAKRAADSLGPELETIVADGRPYLAAPPILFEKSRARTIRLLPAFDEYLIAYADRSAAIPDGSRKKAISSNGLFWPTIVIGGKVAGLWSRTARKRGAEVELDLFEPQGEATMKAIGKEAVRYRAFMAG